MLEAINEPADDLPLTCVYHCSKHPSDLSLTACLARFLDPRTGKAPAEERILAEVGNQVRFRV